MERRPQRRLLARQPAAAFSPDHQRSGVPLRNAERRGPTKQPELTVVVDEAIDPAPAAAHGVRTWNPGVLASRKPQGARVSAAISGRKHPGCRELVTIRSVCTTGLAEVQ